MRSKEQIEISKRIKITEVLSVLCELDVICSEHHLRPAKRILESLLEQPGESPAEKMVPQIIQEPHGFFFHGIHQARSIDKISLTAGDGVVKLRKVLRRYCQVRIEDHENVAGSYF